MSKRPSSTPNLSTTPQQVRIIAGRWKGRMLPVARGKNVRPTPNRVRETVFNWLQGYLPGSNCLDLFAGSGALGFESVSRGAAMAIIVDDNAKVIESLREQVNKFAANDEITLIHADGIAYLNQAESKFDIVYLDPPFNKFNLEQLLVTLTNVDILSQQAMIYMESSLGQLPQNLPSTWQWWRQSKASQVEFGLIATN